jgi:hypothetical protein
MGSKILSDKSEKLDKYDVLKGDGIIVSRG